MSVIEDYLDCIDSLPVDLTRMLTEIREQDSLAKDNVKRIENLSDDLHKTFLDNAENDRINICNDLLSALGDNLLLGQKKVELAQKTYDMVSARIKRIDEDAAIIEEEEFTSTKAPRTYTNNLNEIKNIKVNSISSIEIDDNSDNTNMNSSTPNNTSSHKEKKSTSDSSKRKRPRENKDKDGEKDKNKDKNDKDISDTKSPTPLKKESKHKSSNKTRKHSSDIKHSKNSNNDKSVVMTSDIEIDPNEPTYCKCHQVSFGEMIACDNKDCAIEWFHYACVGLVGPPEGKWYCDDCAALMAKKNKKK